MSTPPPLPAGDDPHELLGVPPDASEDQIKRAYVERIKVYRPDRAPAEFQRIRAAYEEATERLSWIRFTADGDENDDGDESSARHPTETVEEPASRIAIWAHVRDGDLARVETELENARAERAGDPLGHAQSFLLDEFLGRPFDAAAERLLAGLEIGADLAPWIEELLSPAERHGLAAHPRCRLELLLPRIHDSATWRLCRERRDALLLRDEGATLLEELDTESFRQAAGRDDSLRSLALGAAVATVFRHPGRSDELYEWHAREPVETDSFEEMFLIRRDSRKDWQEWRSSRYRNPELMRLVELYPVLATEELPAAEISRSAEKHATRLADGAAYLATHHPMVFFLCMEALDTPDRSDPTDPENAEDDVVTRLEWFVRNTDAELDRNGLNTLTTLLLGCTLIGTIPMFIFLGWWGLVGIAAFIASLVLFMRLDGRLYHTIVRPAAIRAIRRERCTPGDLLAAMKAHKKGCDDIGRFDDEIEEDGSLQFLALAIDFEERVCRCAEEEEWVG